MQRLNGQRRPQHQSIQRLLVHDKVSLRLLLTALFMVLGTALFMALSSAVLYAAESTASDRTTTTQNAAGYCHDKRQFRIAYAACLDATLEQHQRELQTWITKFELDLTEKAEKDGRDDALTMYRQSLTLYQQYGLKHCRWQYQASLPDSQAAATRYKICLIENTVQHIETLKHIQL